EAPLQEPPHSDTASPQPHLLCLSARSQPALQSLAQRYSELLPSLPPNSLPALCATAAVGRAHFPFRRALLVSDLADASSQLKALATTPPAPGASLTDASAPRVAFLFPGQGSQYLGMGQQLYARFEAFHKALDQCAELLVPLLDVPLLNLLWGHDGLEPAE